MTTKTIYISFDGQSFENKRVCALYELNKYIEEKSFEILDNQRHSLLKNSYVTQEELDEAYEKSEIIFIRNIDVLEALRTSLSVGFITPLEEDEMSELNPHNYGYYNWEYRADTDNSGWVKME